MSNVLFYAQALKFSIFSVAWCTLPPHFTLHDRLRYFRWLLYFGVGHKWRPLESCPEFLKFYDISMKSSLRWVKRSWFGPHPTNIWCHLWLSQQNIYKHFQSINFDYIRTFISFFMIFYRWKTKKSNPIDIHSKSQPHTVKSLKFISLNILYVVYYISISS